MIIEFSNRRNSLATGIVSHLEHINPNNEDHINHNNHGSKREEVSKLKIVTMGAPVGPTTSTVMIEKDKVFLFMGNRIKKNIHHLIKYIKLIFQITSSLLLSN